MGGSTSLAVLHNGVCTQSECGHLPSLWRCVFFCPNSHHKAIAGRSSSRWRAGRSTSSRRRSTGRFRRVEAASRRSGRSARRAGPREARFVHVADLERQSRAMVFAWWNSCIIRPFCAADRQLEELEESFAAGPALQLSLFQDISDWLPLVLLCRVVDVRRSGPGPGRRAHEAVLRDCVSTLFSIFSQDVGGGLLHRTARARHRESLVKTRSRHTS